MDSHSSKVNYFLIFVQLNTKKIFSSQLETLLSHDPDLTIDYEDQCPKTVLSLTGTRSFNFIEPLKLRYQQMNIVALTQIYQSQIFANVCISFSIFC